MKSSSSKVILCFAINSSLLKSVVNSLEML